MLIQFNFKNFKSFRDEAILDLSATQEKSFSERVITVGKERILPVAVIYGANASGKTNVYEAFEYMSEYVVYSFQYDDEEDKESKFKRVPPFMFDSQSADAESTFEVYFTLPLDSSGEVYKYGFSLNKNEIIEEWLNSKAKSAKKYSTIFYRNTVTKELDLSGIPEKSRENISIALENRVLVASLGAKLKIGKCKLVRDWFFANEFANFGDPVTNFFMSRRLPKDFVNQKSVQKKIIDYLASFDNHIKDFKVKKVPDIDGNEKMYSIQSLHKMTDSSDMAEIPLGEESAGTLKMFALYPDLEKVLEKGSVFIIDELNARLYPLLVRNFLLAFLNPETNPNHAQLIFTTHDTWQLANRLLREDEIWFAEKDEKGLSSLYSLADFENDTKQDENVNYEALYLTGRYGAIPKMTLLQILGGVSNG